MNIYMIVRMKYILLGFLFLFSYNVFAAPSENSEEDALEALNRIREVRLLGIEIEVNVNSVVNTGFDIVLLEEDHIF